MPNPASRTQPARSRLTAGILNKASRGELERRWEESLREVKSAEEQLDKDVNQAPVFAIPADLLEMLKNVSARLPDIWNQGLLKTQKMKSLLRSLIDKVVIHQLARDQVQLVRMEP